MLPLNHPDRIRIAFDDRRLVANDGLLLPATPAQHLGLPQMVQKHLDLGDGPGRANTDDKIMTLVYSRRPAADDFSYLHSGNLPVCHPCTSDSKYRNSRLSGSQGGQRP